MDVSADHLGGLPALLAFLGGSPTGDEVATQLVAGAGRHFDAAVGAVLLLEPDGLRVIGRHGYSPADPDARYPLWGDLPVSQAVREGAVIVRDTTRAEDEYADLMPAWSHAPELAGRRAIVCGPISARGISLGGYFLACDSAPTWDSLAYGLLDGVGSSLALWLERDGAREPARATPQLRSSLTSRQLAVVAMLATGRTTAAIAAALGCSVSTVKGEIQRVSRILGTSDRIELVDRARAHGLVGGDAPTSEAP